MVKTNILVLFQNTLEAFTLPLQDNDNTDDDKSE